jgi:hypothetical protein
MNQIPTAPSPKRAPSLKRFFIVLLTPLGFFLVALLITKLAVNADDSGFITGAGMIAALLTIPCSAYCTVALWRRFIPSFAGRVFVFLITFPVMCLAQMLMVSLGCGMFAQVDFR